MEYVPNIYEMVGEYSYIPLHLYVFRLLLGMPQVQIFLSGKKSHHFCFGLLDTTNKVLILIEGLI